MGELDPNIASIFPVSREFAASHVDELLELALQIPKAPWIAEDIVGTTKPDGRVEHAKWDHTFVLMQGREIIGFVMAYERDAEPNDNYSMNTLYTTGLAVRPDHQGQGHARRLMRAVLEPVLAHGFSDLSGPVVFSLQTNAADWNKPVIGFYESLGFKPAGNKHYDNRTDVVMRADVEEVRAAIQARP